MFSIYIGYDRWTCIDFKSQPYAFPVLIGLGSSVLGIGLISICISCTIINFRASRQMRDAIAIESNKYSTRLSMPCTWQFDIDKRWERSRGATRRVVTERVSDMILFR